MPRYGQSFWAVCMQSCGTSMASNHMCKAPALGCCVCAPHMSKVAAPVSACACCFRGCCCCRPFAFCLAPCAAFDGCDSCVPTGFTARPACSRAEQVHIHMRSGTAVQCTSVQRVQDTQPVLPAPSRTAKMASDFSTFCRLRCRPSTASVTGAVTGADPACTLMGAAAFGSGTTDLFAHDTEDDQGRLASAAHLVLIEEVSAWDLLEVPSVKLVVCGLLQALLHLILNGDIRGPTREAQRTPNWGGHSCGSRRRAGCQCRILTVSSVSVLFFQDFLLCLEGIAVDRHVQNPACKDAVRAQKLCQYQTMSNQTAPRCYYHSITITSPSHIRICVLQRLCHRDSVHADMGRRWLKAVHLASSCPGNSDEKLAACHVLTSYLATLQYAFTQTFRPSDLQFERTRPFWLRLPSGRSFVYCNILPQAAVGLRRAE